MKRLALLSVLSCSSPNMPCRTDAPWATSPFAGMSPPLTSSLFARACRGSVTWVWFSDPASPSGDDAVIDCNEKEPRGWVRLWFRRPEFAPETIEIHAHSGSAADSFFDRLVAPMLVPDNADELRDSVRRGLPWIMPTFAADERRLLDYHIPELREQLGLPPDVRSRTMVVMMEQFTLGRGRYDLFDRPSHGFVGGIFADADVPTIELVWSAYLPPRPEVVR